MDINEKKTFEELLREKVEGHEFPFEGSSWAQMQSKLQAHQASTAVQHTTMYKSLLLKAGKIVVGVISGSAIVYTTLSLSGMLDDKKTASQENLQQKEIALQTPVDAKESAVNTATLSLDEESQSQSAISPEVNNSNAAPDNHVSDADSKHLDVNSNVNASSSAYKATVKNTFGTKSSASYTKNRRSESAVNTSVKQSGLKNADQALVNAVRNSKAETVEGKTSFNKNSAVAAIEKPVANADNAANKTAAGITDAYKAMDKNASAVNVEKAGDNALAVNTSKEEATANTVISESDSILADPLKGGKYPEKQGSSNKPKTKMLFGFHAGANGNYAATTENGSKKSNYDISPSFGVNASFPLSSKFAFQAGAQYISHSIYNVSHASAVVQYAILQDSSVTKTTFSKSTYVEFPLVIKYAILPRVNVFAGLRTSLLIGAKANMTQEQYINGRLTSTTPLTDAEKFAQFNGLRTVDFGIPFGVEFAASRKISLAVTGNMGLTDFTRNNVFSNEQTDKYRSLQLHLNFKPF